MPTEIGGRDEGEVEPALSAAPTCTLASWNIHGFRGLPEHRLAAILAALAELAPDVVTLQEVPGHQAEAVATALSAEGIAHVEFPWGNAVRLAGTRAKHGVMVASRWPLQPRDRSWLDAVDYPELVVDVDVRSPLGTFAVVGVHIPNGSGNGWELKTRALEAIVRRIERIGDTPTLIAGDFNEPDTLAGSEVTTFGTQPRWVTAVEGIFVSRAVRHAWCDLHQVETPPVSFELTSKHGVTRRRFDHILVSPGVRVLDAGYQHSWRLRHLSDHSGATVAFSL